MTDRRSDSHQESGRKDEGRITYYKLPVIALLLLQERASMLYLSWIERTEI